MSDKPKSTHGGKRPGAGMKPKDRKVDKSLPVYLYADQREKLTPSQVRKIIDDHLNKFPF